MSSKQFQPKKGKILLPETKVIRDYGKRKPNTYSVQAHDGLLIPQVPNLLKVKPKKLKQADVFDVKGDGKAGPKPLSTPEVKDYSKKNHTGFIYSYKKRI